VTNLENGKSVEVTINDRGPYAKHRAIDLSAKAAKTLGMTKRGRRAREDRGEARRRRLPRRRAPRKCAGARIRRRRG